MINKRENYKDQLKVIDTEEKAYFLGFAFGDGCNSYSNGYKFTMASTMDDLSVFLKFGEIFPFVKVCSYKSHPQVVYLENYEKSLVQDLLKLGLVQNKKKSDELGLFKIPNISKELIQHFIRGFFDADGSVFTQKRYRSRNNIRTEIGLGTENFCLELKALFESLNFKFSYVKRLKKDSSGNYHYGYILSITSRKESLKFADYIYNNASLYLTRKKEIFYRYKYSELQLKKVHYPKCPRCNLDVIGNGWRNGKQRFFCKSCNLNFTSQ